MVSRRRKFAFTTVLLILWQIGAGFMLSMPAHAQGAVAMDSAADAGEPPCHGHQAAEESKPPADVPPCCQTHGCHGYCVVSPALPAAVRLVVIRPAETNHFLAAAVVWHSAPPVEFFRPPI